MYRRYRMASIVLVFVLLVVSVVATLTIGRNRQAPLNTALITAILRDDTDAAIALLEKGASADSVDYSQKPSITQQIFEHQRAPDALVTVMRWSFTTMKIGTVYGRPRPENLRLVRALLDHGADANSVDRSGKSALTLAISSGHLATAWLLLDRNADVNHRSNYGDTALMEAALSGDLKLVRALIAKHADVGVTNNNGRTALSLARLLKHHEIASELDTAVLSHHP